MEKESILEKYEKMQNKIGLVPIRELNKKLKIISGIIFGVLILAELVLYNSMKNLTSNAFTDGKLSYNPILILFRCMRDDILVLLLFVLIAYLFTKTIPVIFIRNTGEDPRGFKVASGSDATQGQSGMLSMEDKKNMFELLPATKPDGLILGVDKDSGKLITSPWDHPNPNYAPSNRNIAVVGPSGTRKTSGVLLGFIFDMIQSGHSIMTTDPKGEIYRETLAAALQNGYNVKVLNLVAGQLECSDGWDIMKLIRDAYNPHTAANLVSGILLGPTKDAKDFWYAGSLNLLNLALLYVAKAETFVSSVPKNTKGQDRIFSAVIDLINSEDLKSTIETAINGSTKDKKLLWNYYNTWSKNTQAEQIRSGLCTSLNLFNDEALTTLLSEDDIDFNELNDTKTIIYAICSDKDSVYKNITTLFTTFLFNEVTNIADRRENGRLKRPFWAIFEEFNNIGYVADLSVKVSTLRSRNIGIILCYQNITQAMDTYGSMGINGKYEWETIFGNCALKLCLGSDDPETSKYFSAKSGLMTILEESTAQDVNTFAPSSLQFNMRERKTVSKKQVPVMQPDAIEHLPIDEIIIFQTKFNCTVEKKYFYKNHPLYNVKIVDESGKVIIPHHLGHLPKWQSIKRKIEKEQLSGQKVDELEVSQEVIYKDMIQTVSTNAEDKSLKSEERPTKDFLTRMKNFMFEEIPDEDSYIPTYSQQTNYDSLLEITQTIPKDMPPSIVNTTEDAYNFGSNNYEEPSNKESVPKSAENTKKQSQEVYDNPFGDNPYF